MKNCLISFGVLVFVCAVCVGGIYWSRRQEEPTIYIDIAIDAEAWLDINANGIRESDEPPLEGVCIAIQRSFSFTKPIEDESCQSKRSRSDAKGWWGTASNTTCHLNVYAYVPKGYRATTPLQFDACQKIQFGFVRVEQ